MVGSTQSFGATNYDALIIKLDMSSDSPSVVWAKRIDGGGVDEFDGGVVVDDSGNVYVVGHTRSVAGDSDVLLMKFDSNGNLIWNKVWRMDQEDWAYGIAYGKYLYITGYTTSVGTGDSDILILKFNSDGDLLGQYVYGGSDDDEGDEIFLRGDSVYIVGYTKSKSASFKRIKGQIIPYTFGITDISPTIEGITGSINDDPEREIGDPSASLNNVRNEEAIILQLRPTPPVGGEIFFPKFENNNYQSNNLLQKVESLLIIFAASILLLYYIKTRKTLKRKSA